MKSIVPSVSRTHRVAASALLAWALVSPSHAAQSNGVGLASTPGASGQTLLAYPYIAGISSGIDYFAPRADFLQASSITSFMATLFSASPRLGSVDAMPPGPPGLNSSFFLGSLAPVAYQLGLSGPASASRNYGGLLRVTGADAPDTEPETWMILMVGAGLIALRLRRTSRLDGARRFG